MKKILLTALVAGTAFAAISPADARQGCGVGYHRGPWEGCRPNLGPGPVVVPGGPLVIGTYYPHHGYWDGRRYWWHRRAWHTGWRYY